MPDGKLEPATYYSYSPEDVDEDTYFDNYGEKNLAAGFGLDWCLHQHTVFPDSGKCRDRQREPGELQLLHLDRGRRNRDLSDRLLERQAPPRTPEIRRTMWSTARVTDCALSMVA